MNQRSIAGDGGFSWIAQRRSLLRAVGFGGNRSRFDVAQFDTAQDGSSSPDRITRQAHEMGRICRSIATMSHEFEPTEIERFFNCASPAECSDVVVARRFAKNIF